MLYYKHFPNLYTDLFVKVPAEKKKIWTLKYPPKKGPNWELNPGPLAPKASIILLDHSAVL